MEPLYIQLFWNFSIIYKNEEILHKLTNSSKCLSVLKYLILNMVRSVPVSELISTFWQDDNGTNPENAVKTLVSRIRKTISAKYPELWECIITEKNTYRWNCDFPCEVDVFLFEDCCRSLLDPKCLATDWKRLYPKTLSLYKGSLDAPSSMDDWIKGQSLYYQQMYLKVTCRYVQYLKEEREHESIINTCRTALNIDNLDEELNLHLMCALKETNQNHAALTHYRHFTDMYYKYLGIEPPEKTLSFYRELIKADLSAKESLEVIREKLVDNARYDRAFMCDYSIFKDIYQLQMRNAERLGLQVFFALVTIEHAVPTGVFEPLLLDRIMQDLIDILLNSLRKGDVISRYSTSQYAILLHMDSIRYGESVIDRIQKAFTATRQKSYARLLFQMDYLTSKSAGVSGVYATNNAPV